MDPIQNYDEAVAATNDIEAAANEIDNGDIPIEERTSRIKLQTQRLRAFLLTLE